MNEESNVPAIRFKGFTDPWEQRQLGELYARVTEKNDGSFGITNVISVANMYFNTNARVTDEDYLLTYNVFRAGDIAFEGNRSKHFRYGRLVENQIGDGIISHVFEVFRPIRSPHCQAYWGYAINNEHVMRRVLARSTKAATMMHNIVPADFLNESLPVPVNAEQEQIGTLLQRLDSLITLHQRQQRRRH